MLREIFKQKTIGPIKVFHDMLRRENSFRDYMERWILETPIGSIRVHKFVSSDTDPYHDHPWGFFSVVLWGEYLEQIWVKDGVEIFNLRSVGSMAIRFPRHRHKVLLLQGDRQCWTLVVTGPRVREWGLWPNGRFVNWRDY